MIPAAQGSQADDLVWIRRFSMRFARAMARFATLPFRPLMFSQRGLPVRALVIALGDVFMAGLAGFRSDILRWINRLVTLRGG